MERAYFRFYAELNDFLPLHKRQANFVHVLKETAAIKDSIEALGVPHPEVALILVNGESVDFSYLVQNGDRISVYPKFRSLDISLLSQVQPQPLTYVCFILDVHLGKLATYLRLLGFDALYQNDYQDQELADLTSQTKRILLTRDRGVLKRSIVTYGYCVRESNPETQVLEVLQHFDLFGEITPLQRCLRCNGSLQPVAKESVCDRLPSQTRKHYEEFSICPACDQIYWKGAHHERIQQFIDRVLHDKHHQ
uniref:Mut7-C RNAse domain-containing protein n=1 Tax=Trichocoleus desertorum TaxID=1481672 RepID=UPI0025B476C9|nr:Mut7-C RNAse domain-containing protein [Trichocoleus desertorum]